MEMCVMDSLKWDVLAVCPNDFLDAFLDVANEWGLSQDEMKLLHKHSHAFTALCSIDYSFAFYSPSMIASACLLVALNGISTQSSSSILGKLSQLAQIDVDFLRHVTQQVKALFKSEFTNLSDQQEVNMEEEELSFSLEQTQFDFTCSSLSEQSFINDDIANQTFNVKDLSSSSSLSPQFKPKNNTNKFSSRLSLNRRQSMRRSGRARG